MKRRQRGIFSTKFRTAARFAHALLPLYALPAVAQESSTAKTWAFEHPEDTFKLGAALDLRSLNEKEAGENGFIKLSPDGSSFVEGNGKPIRFWAVVTDVYRQSPEDMAKHARFLAKLGVNMVRLHTQIAPTEAHSKITDVNQKEIDGIWRCVAAMKKEGIYTTISPYWANGKPVTNWGIDGYTGSADLWGVLFFNEKLQEGYKAWVKALYAPKNPYTGLPLAQDPAVAIIQVQNEDGMFFWTMQAMKPEQQAVLSKKFGRWLVAKYGSLDKAKAAWENTGNDGDDFANGKAGLYITWFLTQNQSGGIAKRIADQTQFLAETQRKFYVEIADYYHKTLGCKQLVNGSNWKTADAAKLDDIERWTNSSLDVIAVNKYTGGLHMGDNNGWRIDPGHHFTNNSCLLDPRSLPTNLKQPVGHPFIITESSWVHPEGFQSEGPMLMAAYQSLTGVDAFYWFAAGGAPEYETNPYLTFLTINGQHPMNKWTCATPELMGGFPAAALMFRLGYIQQGQPAIHEERSLAEMWQRQNPLIAEDGSFDPNRDTGNTAKKSELAKGLDPLAFLVGPVETKYGGNPDNDTALDLTQYIDHAKKTVKSVTGEIALDYGNGILTINAPKAQGVCGFLKKTTEFRLKDVILRSGNDYAAVAVVAMDNLPLNLSKKILVQVGTYARPTGWKTKLTDFKGDDGKTSYRGYEISNTGAMPWQIENTDVTLILKNPGITRATLLDTSGYAVKEVPGRTLSGKFSINLPSNTMYLILD